MVGSSYMDCRYAIYYRFSVGVFHFCTFFKTIFQDPHRLHYEPAELMVFEGIECEWPLFFAYLIIDGVYSNNMEQVTCYQFYLIYGWYRLWLLWLTAPSQACELS